MGSRIHRVLLDIFNGIKDALGIHRLPRELRRRDAIADLQLALELQKNHALFEAGKKLEEAAKRALS